MEERKENAQIEKAWWQPAMALFLRMSVWIVVPVLISAFIGKKIDLKYDSSPWALLVCVGISFLVSMIGIVNLASKEYKKIDSEKKESQEIKK